MTLKASQYKKLISEPIIAKVKKHFVHLSNLKNKPNSKPSKKEEINEEGEDEDVLDVSDVDSPMESDSDFDPHEM